MYTTHRIHRLHQIHRIHSMHRILSFFWSPQLYDSQGQAWNLPACEIHHRFFCIFGNCKNALSFFTNWVHKGVHGVKVERVGTTCRCVFFVLLISGWFGTKTLNVHTPDKHVHINNTYRMVWICLTCEILNSAFLHLAIAYFEWSSELKKCRN